MVLLALYLGTFTPLVLTFAILAIRKDQDIQEDALEHSDFAEDSAPRNAIQMPSQQRTSKFDVFISHASEDKDTIARPLYEGLSAAGLAVWYDDAVLHLGDSLRRKIDEGLARCNYGVVIISRNFFDKEWPQRELDGLAAREVADGKTVILPIWHEINRDILIRRSPTLADRLAAKSSEGIPSLVRKILEVVRQ